MANRKCEPPCTYAQLMAKDVLQLNDKLDEVLKKLGSLEKKFASKWVERVVAFFVIMLALSALYVIFSHVGLPIPKV